MSMILIRHCASEKDDSRMPDPMIPPHAVRAALFPKRTAMAEAANALLGTTETWVPYVEAHAAYEHGPNNVALGQKAKRLWFAHREAVNIAEMAIDWALPPHEIANARAQLGLSPIQFGRMLGYRGRQVVQQVLDIESGRRVLREGQRRLIEAYLSGYRPPDWPYQDEVRAYEDRMGDAAHPGDVDFE